MRSSFAVPGDGHERALEAALQADWDADTAAVYADLLTARGDPRGELIAIDLALAKAPTHELLDRKRELVTAWLGDRIPDWTWQPRNVEHGLLRGYGVATSTTQTTQTIDGYLSRLFDVAGSRVRDLSVYGSNAQVREAIAAIAARPAPALPWLRALTLHRVDGTHPIAKDSWAALVEATPHLRELTLIGTGVAVSPIHPAIQTLRVVGPAVAIGRASIPTVVELGLTFTHDRYRTPPSDAATLISGLVNPRTFPALRRLDLSTNRKTHYGPEIIPVVTAFLDSLEHLDMLELVRVPPAEDATALIEILDRHPRLQIEIACMHTTLGVSHPRLKVPAPYAWPQTMHSREALNIDFPGPSCDELALSSVIDNLEEQFEAMRPDAQQAWIAFWNFLNDLPSEDANNETVYKPFPAATFLLALEALDGNGRGDNIAAALRAARLPADATVTLSRYWGW